MGKFTAIPQSVFEELQINAGLILKDFDPVAGNFANEDILAATSGYRIEVLKNKSCIDLKFIKYRLRNRCKLTHYFFLR